MESKRQYYLEDNGNLWKKENGKEFFFTRKTLEWIESKIVYILPGWDYNNKISDKDGEKVLKDYTNEGKWDEEEEPIRYFANDNDVVFAIDLLGNEFYVLADMTLKPAEKGTVDCMWGGLTKREAESIVEKEYKEEKWILAGAGKKLVRFIGDYEGIIWLGNYQGGLPKSEIGYRSEVIHDDGIDIPATVAYFEAETIDELKTMTEKRMRP